MKNNKPAPKKGPPYKLHPSEAKEWTDKYGEGNDKVRAILFVNSAIQSHLIDAEDEFAAYLLYNSMESRINSCKYGQGVYGGVHCGWDNVIVACTDIITKKPDFWKDYCELTNVYIEKDHQLAFRPTVDRIKDDPKIGYRLSNIAVLSHGNNAKKALAKAHYVFNLNLEDPLNLQMNQTFKKYESKKEAVESLGLKFNGDSGKVYEIDGKTYLIQSEDLTLGYKELEYDESNDTELMSAWIPVGVVRNDKGEQAIIRQEITFPAMAIKLKGEAQ